MSQVTTSKDLNVIKSSPWISTGVMKDVLFDEPRPILSRDDQAFVLDEERPVSRNMKITYDMMRRFGYTSDYAKCKKFSLWILSSEIDTIAGLSYQDWDSKWDRPCVSRSFWASERYISTLRKWNEVIIQGESHWDQQMCLDHSWTDVTRRPLKCSGDHADSRRVRVEFVGSNPYSKYRWDTECTRASDCAIKFDFNSDSFWSFFEAYIQWEYRATEFCHCFVWQWCKTFWWLKFYERWWGAFCDFDMDLNSDCRSTWRECCRRWRSVQWRWDHRRAVVLMICRVPYVSEDDDET